MTDVYTQENGSKKKFLAPLLVILLCMVSLTGAGYAYSATVANTGDDVIVDGLTVELYTKPASGDPAIVDDAMYSVDDLHIGTHTVNGKAAKIDGKAFKNDGTTEAFNEENLTTYQSGYYVEVSQGTGAAVGVKEAPVATDFANASAISTAVTDGKLIKLSDDYTLKVNNQNKDTTAVQVTMKAKWKDALTSFDGLNGVYIVVKDGSSVLAYETVRAYDDSAAATIIASGVTVGEHSYTIEAYVSLTDYRAASVPAALAGDAPTGFFNEKFSVVFAAETA